MAKILLITEAQYRAGVNKIGDIIGVFDDSHKFSTKEIEAILLVSVPGTKTDIESTAPRHTRIQKAATLEWTENFAEVKNVWEDTEGNLREIVKDPKYKLYFNGSEIKDSVGSYPENLTIITTIKELSKNG